MKPTLTQPEVAPTPPAMADHPEEPAPPVLPSEAVPDAPPSTWALRIIAIVALLYCMRWAADFLIPLLFGLLLSYTLSPIVFWMERLRIPRVVGAGLVTLALVGSAAVLTNTLYREARIVVDELPLATWKVRNALSRLDDGQARAEERRVGKESRRQWTA